MLTNLIDGVLMTRQIFFLTAIFLLLFFSLPLPAKALDILVLPTVIDQEMDAWQHVPANSEPAIYPTEQIYRDQPFRLLVIGKDYVTDNLQHANITYTVQVLDPSGSALLGQGATLELYKGLVGSSTMLLLSRQHLTLDFSETDPYGTYLFQITARDQLADQETTATAEIVLAPVSDRADFDSSEEFSNWIADYYRAPDPPRAITALLQYVDTEPEARQKQVSLLTFLSRVVQSNRFLWPHLKSIYSAADLEDRKKILLLSALSDQQDDSFFSSLDPELMAFYLDAKKINLPVPTDRPVTGIEIDILWAEFMATGTIAPIRKLVGALYLESARGTEALIASGELEMTPEAKARAAQEAVYRYALSSLVYNGERHSLVKQYLGYIYELGQPEPVIKAQIENILAILQQRTNEEEVRKHLDKQTNEP